MCVCVLGQERTGEFVYACMCMHLCVCIELERCVCVCVTRLFTIMGGSYMIVSSSSHDWSCTHLLAPSNTLI